MAAPSDVLAVRTIGCALEDAGVGPEPEDDVLL
jgi:hypothetical protein